VIWYIKRAETMIFPLFFDCVKISKINLLYFNQKEKKSFDERRKSYEK